MAYDSQLLDDIQAASDIVEIINASVPLKRAGRNFKGLCPFHQEKTPSFIVNPEKQIFHCFGCGTGGNVFTFLMKFENATFPEAVRQLADRARIPLPEKAASKEEGPSLSERLYEIYELAADFYHRLYLDRERGREARGYFEKRGFEPALAVEWKIGWASSQWRMLFEFLSKKGFSNELLLRSGLVSHSAKGPFYDAFRGRLLFPIRNLRGKVVGFGGRILSGEDGPPAGEARPESGPKYLNSAESPIFSKRRELFGLDVAKKFIDRERRQILIVEGYFDFLRLYSRGFKAAAATLGTSLTEDHVRVLKRFADEAIFVYDGDKAGEEASMRGLEVFLEGGMNVKVVRLPQGYDPDDFIAKKGPEAFAELLAAPRDFFDFKLDVLMSRFDRRDSLGLMKITNAFLETFVKIESAVLLDHYLKRLAASLGIQEQSLRTELSKLKAKLSGSVWRENPLPGGPPKDRGELNHEVLLIALMVDEPGFCKTALEELRETDFKESWARELFGMLETRKKAGDLSWPQLLNRFTDEDAKTKLTKAASIEWEEGGREQAFRDCLEKVRRNKIETKLQELRRQIAKAEQEGDQARLGAFVKEYQAILKST